MAAAGQLFRLGIGPVVDGFRITRFLAAPVLGSVIGEAAADRLERSLAEHFRSGRVLHEAFRDAVCEAGEATRSWINGGSWLNAVWKRELMRDRPVALPDFAAWLQSGLPPQHPFADPARSSNDAIRTHLRQEVEALVEGLRAATDAPEFGEDRLLEVLTAAADVVSLDESDRPAGATDTTDGTLLGLLFEYHEFDFFAEAVGRVPAGGRRPSSRAGRRQATECGPADGNRGRNRPSVRRRPRVPHGVREGGG